MGLFRRLGRRWFKGKGKSNHPGIVEGGQRETRLAEMQRLRDELARRIEAEPNPEKRERGRVELARIDRRIARAAKRGAIPLPVILAIIQAIVWLIQWLQPTS